MVDLTLYHNNYIPLSSMNVVEYVKKVINLFIAFLLFVYHPISSFLNPLALKLLPPGLFPPERDIGHPMTLLMDFRRRCGLEVGGKHNERWPEA